MTYTEPAAPVKGVPFLRLADVVGDGSGETNAVGNYAAGQGFKVTAQPGEELLIWRVIIHIEDAGAIASDAYGALPALANGFLARKLNANGSVNFDLLDGHNVKINSDWGHTGEHLELIEWASGSIKSVYATWDFVDMFGVPLTLYAGQSIEFYAQDNLTGLLDHHFTVTGQRNAEEV